MRRKFLSAVLIGAALSLPVLGSGEDHALGIDYPDYPAAPGRQSEEQAEAKSGGCMSCHTQTDRKTMHANPCVVLGCTDCHGGDAGIENPDGVGPQAPAYEHAMEQAHVSARFPTAGG